MKRDVVKGMVPVRVDLSLRNRLQCASCSHVLRILLTVLVPSQERTCVLSDIICYTDGSNVFGKEKAL